MIHHDLELPKRFDGARYKHEVQFESLKGQIRVAYRILLSGKRMTLGQIVAEMLVRMDRKYLSQTSVSANIRNLRKCGVDVKGDYGESGEYEYWLEREPQGRLF